MDSTFVRKGDCNGCGWCCQFLSVLRVTVPVAIAKDEDQARFFTLRHAVTGPDGRMRFLAHQFAPCISHDNVNKCCTVYAERPQVCSQFPVSPDHIEGTPCSYWFERDTEKGVERRGGLGSPYPTPPRFTEIPTKFERLDDPERKPFPISGNVVLKGPNGS